jgi:hypothetical protein
MEGKIFKSLDEDIYHSQEGQKKPLFSYSTGRTILDKSPWHAYLNHPLLGNQKTFKATKAMDTGNLIHKLLLGEGAEIVKIDFDDYRKKEARELKDQAYLDKKIPVLTKEYDRIFRAIGIISDQIKSVCPEFFTPHESELSARWTMNNGVDVQNRWDWISPEIATQIDLKTTTDASPGKVERKIVDMHYDLQESLYTMAANELWPELAGRWKWVYIFIEVEPPYAVSVIETCSSFKALGEMKMFRASNTWAECLESGKWPGYGRKTVYAPQWALKKETEISEMSG